jgi:hypothetical protein
VLLDAEEKQAKSPSLSNWLAELKDVFHDFIDVLDEFECEDLRRQVVKKHGSTGKKVRRFFCLLTRLPSVLKWAIESRRLERG